MRCDLKSYPLATAICALCFVIAAALAQPPATNAKLTENPGRSQWVDATLDRRQLVENSRAKIV
jgi:hypothetical protein